MDNNDKLFIDCLYWGGSMALRKNELLDALDLLRDQIKDEEHALGRTPTVCSDEVLKEIAEKNHLR